VKSKNGADGGGTKQLFKLLQLKKLETVKKERSIAAPVDFSNSENSCRLC
jgi:hypothetical protein